ncbi:RDD family, partial [Mycoplasma putrefaciens]
MFVYFVVFCWLLKAQSLGKRLFKIQLISLKKHKITFKDLFLREAVFIFIPW